MSALLPYEILKTLGGQGGGGRGRASKKRGKKKKNQDRKTLRKEKRNAKKRKRVEHEMKRRMKRLSEREDGKTDVRDSTSIRERGRKQQRRSVKKNYVVEVDVDEESEEEPEDQEIDYLERKLGLRGKAARGAKKKKENWKRLQKEWKRDGFGDDFGSFIADLDNLRDRLKEPVSTMKTASVKYSAQSEDPRHSMTATSSSSSSSSDSETSSSSDDDEDGTEKRLADPREVHETKRKKLRSHKEEQPEDQEIDYLERKLGLKGKKASGKKGKRENLKRLKKEWQRDGFDDDFADFIFDLDKLNERLRDDDGESASSNNDDDDDDEEDAQSSIEASGDSEADDSSDGDDDDDDVVADEDTMTIPSQKDIDIYGRTEESPDGSLKTAVKKYVPPRLRVSNEQSSDSKSANRIRVLQRQIQGQLNRLSESNIEPIVGVLRSCFASNPRMQVSAVLASKILQSCAGQIRENLSLMRSYAAVLAALHISEGPEIGAYFLEDLARRYDARRKEAAADDANTSAKYEGLNVLLILLSLYQFSIVHHSFIVDIATHLVEDLSSPAHLELLLQVLMHCGFALRKEEPGSLLRVLKRVHRQADTHRDEWKRKGHDSRAQFMLETIGDLSSNRQRAAQKELQDGCRHLRVWVQRQKQRDQRAHPPLRVPWDDLMAAGHRGRWWIAGSAWSGRRKDGDDSNGDRTRAAEDDDGSARSVTRGASAELLALAAKHRMSTDTRKAIFCVLMGSSDYLDAFERLVRLGLKGPQRREILRVLVHCCGVSRRYNPYFGLVAKQQCSYDHRAKFTLQLCFWDAIKQFGADTVPSPSNTAKTVKKTKRKLTNLAKLLAELVKDFHLSLATLKIVDVLALTPDTTFFLRAFFRELLTTTEPNKLEASFRRIGATKDCSALLHSVSIFLKKNMSKEIAEDPVLRERYHTVRMALRDVSIIANARVSAGVAGGVRS